MKHKFFIGIDVSKSWIDIACIYFDNPEEYFKMNFDNNPVGFEKMLKWIKTKHTKKKECIICFEETGSYSFKLWEYLSEKGWDFIMERGMEIKKSAGIKRGKNDKKDAEMIAKYIFLRSNYINLSSPPVTEIISLMALLTYRDRILKTSLRFKNAANELRSTYERKIYNSIPSESDAIAKDFLKRVKQVEIKIFSLIKSSEKLNYLYNLTVSVPGIKLLTAAHILVYTKAFSKHLDYRKFSCYCGIAPFEYSSGTSIKGKNKIHPIGNKKMKALLGRGALAVATQKTSTSEFAVYYRRKIAEGKHPLVVLNVIKNKMISRVYAAIKRGTPYTKNYHLISLDNL